MSTKMTNRELRLAIESTINSLAPVGGPFAPPAKLPDEARERLSAHLDRMLRAEELRAVALAADGRMVSECRSET